MRYVIVGASAGLGRALAGRLAAEKHDLVLIGRDGRDLDAVAADLSLRFGIAAKVLAADIGKAEDFAEGLTALLAAWKPIDGLLLPVGWARDDDSVDLPPRRMYEIVNINFLSVVEIVQLALPYLAGGGHGVIVGFGSIAGARGRPYNVAYSAAKRALESYFESLRLAVRDRGIRVQFYIPGFLDTNLAYGLRTPLPKADSERFANEVVKRLGEEVGVRYFPAWWRPVCAAVRLVPWWLMRRLNLQHQHE